MKKTIIALLVAAMLIGLMPIGASLATSATTTYATVYSGNEYGVRLRNGPGTNYQNLVTLPSGTTVIMLEQGAVWSRIQAGTTVGYMMSRYLVGGGAGGGDVAYEYTGFVYAGNGSRTWLRSGPNGKRLGLYADNTELRILTYGDDWSRVMIGSSIGYMMTRYISIHTPPEPTPTPAPEPFTALRVNYPYPLVGDTLRPVLTPSTATATYQWERLDKDTGKYIILSTGSTYTVTSSDYLHKIRLTATGTGIYLGTTMSFTTEAVTNDRTITSVNIHNASTNHTSPVVGDSLSAVMAPSSALATYSWRVAGVVKSTTATYTVAAEDIGKQIQLYVTGLDPFTGRASSPLTNRVLSASALNSVKLSTTSPVVGKAVTAVTVPSGLSVSYVWYVNGAQVGTGSSYTPTANDLGHTITVTVSGTGTATGTASSEPSNPVAQALVTSVSIDVTAPAVGSVITAKASPADATVIYNWYCTDDPNTIIATNKQYTVDAAYADKKLYAVATGVGVYGGTATSPTTATVASVVRLTGVTLDNTKPVVGDLITAKLAPATAVDKDNNVYLWYVNGSLAVTSTGNTYKVDAADANSTIHVVVQGGSPNTGSVTSARTAAVANRPTLTGVSIYNQSTSSYVNGGTVYVGQVLYADAHPNLKYNEELVIDWDSGGLGTVGSNPTYTVTKADEGRRINLTINWPGDPWTKAKYNTVYVASSKGMGALDLSRIVPEPGKSPVTSLSGTFVDGKTTRNYSATVKWTPALDQYGHFRSGVDYTANLTFSLPSGFSLASSAISYGSATLVAETINYNTMSATFKVTGDQNVSAFYISGLDAPVINKTPDTSITNTSQFIGTGVKWFDESGNQFTGKFKVGEKYYAKIDIQTVNGFVFSNDQQNMEGKPLFMVAGAESAVVESFNGNTEATIRATYTVTVSGTSAYLTASRTTVPVGSSNKYVQLSATLTNYEGSQDNLAWKWVVSQNTAPGTTIDENGTLTIAYNEPAGKSLTVTATLAADSRYSASINIELTTESSVTGDVAVEFVKAPYNLYHSKAADKSYTYAAIVRNANNENVFWQLSGNKSDKTTLSSDGRLTLSKEEIATTMRITATAQADSSKSSSIDVTVVYESIETNPTITFTAVASSLEPGKSATFKASLVNGGSGKLRFIAGEGATLSNISTNTGDGDYTCTLTINEDTPVGTNTTLIVLYEYLSGTGATIDPKSVVIAVVDPTNNKTGVGIVGPDSITEGSTATFKAVDNPDAAEADQKSVNVKWSVTGIEKGSKTAFKPETGTSSTLKLDSAETAKEITIVVTSVDDSSISASKKITVNYLPVTVNTGLTGDTHYVGDEVNLTATFSKGDAIWSSSDNSVASVDSKGKLTAHKAGEVTITASSSADQSVTTNATFTIRKRAVTINGPASITYEDGIAGKAYIAVQPDPDATITWTLSGNNVPGTKIIDGVLTLSVNETSTAIRITATSSDTNIEPASIAVAITDYPVNEWLEQPKDATLVEGSSEQLTAKVKYGTALFSSADEKIATVTWDGKVTAIAPGTVKITATPYLTNSKTKAVTVTIKVEPLTLLLIPSAETAMGGDTINFEAKFNDGTPSDGISWVIDGPATSGPLAMSIIVNSGAKAGEVITVTATDTDTGKTATAKITVVEKVVTLAAPMNFNSTNTTAVEGEGADTPTDTITSPPPSGAVTPPPSGDTDTTTEDLNMIE